MFDWWGVGVYVSCCLGECYVFIVSYLGVVEEIFLVFFFEFMEVVVIQLLVRDDGQFYFFLFKFFDFLFLNGVFFVG